MMGGVRGEGLTVEIGGFVGSAESLVPRVFVVVLLWPLYLFIPIRRAKKLHVKSQSKLMSYQISNYNNGPQCGGYE